MVEALVLINTEVGNESEVVEKLKSFEEVKEIYVVYGIYDILARIKTDSIDKLKDIVAGKIRKIPNVKATLTMIVVEQGQKNK
ncbi:MAG: Lrp/AsnC family transcriptional regulator [Sulfolobales archaeon]